MSAIILAIFRGLLPFLKESFLEGGTAREWISRNKVTCTWLTFHVAMVIVVAQLITGFATQASIARELVTDNAVLSKEVALLTEQLDVLNARPPVEPVYVNGCAPYVPPKYDAPPAPVDIASLPVGDDAHVAEVLALKVSELRAYIAARQMADVNALRRHRNSCPP